jgi:hypothetical protein
MKEILRPGDRVVWKRGGEKRVKAEVVGHCLHLVKIRVWRMGFYGDREEVLKTVNRRDLTKFTEETIESDASNGMGV